MPMTSYDRSEGEVMPPMPQPAPAAPMPHLPLVPTVSHRTRHPLTPTDTETFVVKDGMQFKEPLLLTSDWAVQPIKVLKAHIAPRWRTKPERLSIGCPMGRFAEQPHDEEMCDSIATPVAGQPAELWLWPAEIQSLPVVQQQQMPLPPLRQVPPPMPQLQLPAQEVLPSLPSLTSLPGSADGHDSATDTCDTAPSTPHTHPCEPSERRAALPEPPMVDIHHAIMCVQSKGLIEAYREQSDALALGIPSAEPADLLPLADAIVDSVEEVLQVHHPQLHAAVSELLNRIPSGAELQRLLAVMEECTGQLLEVPALFSSAFSRMNKEQRARLLKRAVSYVLPLADRPRAGLALEACVRMQCSDGADGGVGVVKPLLDEILQHCNVLMRSGSGNFLVQQCIQLTPSDFADSIARRIKGNVESMSLHRHASHAVEQVLKHVSEPFLHDLLSELVRSRLSARRLACSQSGNYVLQAAINMCPPNLWDVVSERVKACLPDLPPIAAERIWLKLCDKSVSSGMYLDMTPNFVIAPKKPKGRTLKGQVDTQHLPQSVMVPSHMYVALPQVAQINQGHFAYPTQSWSVLQGDQALSAHSHCGPVPAAEVQMQYAAM